MADTKISAGADPGTLVSTDKVPLARSASTTAYAATMAELATYANGAYVPNYYTGSPSMDGTATPGSLAFVARGDHVHPSDTTRVAKAGDTMAGFLTLNANPTSNLHAATKQYVDGSAPVGGPYLSIAAMHDVGRNLIHNAGFTVAQRGAGPWTVSGYTLDRWNMQVITDAPSVRQIALSDADRAAIGDEAARSGFQNTFTGNAAAGAFHELLQMIEDVRRLAGKTVILSFWAVASSALKLGFNATQRMGTGGSPSADVNLLTTGNSVTLSTVWTRYSTSLTFPSLSGKTLGTNNNDNTMLRIAFSCGANNNAFFGNIGVQSGTIQLWGVQLEIGSVATPLEKRDPGQELRQCQRFYQAGTFANTGYAATTGIGYSYHQPFAVPMRALPTLTTSGVTTTNVTSQALNPNGAGSGMQVYTTGAAVGGFIYSGAFQASADL